MKSKLSAIDRIRRARIMLYDKSPFFAYLVTGMQLHETKDVPTMSVDAKANLYFNPEFVQTISDNEMYGVVIHEICHVFLGHCIRRGVRDALIWNLAVDCSVNHIIMNGGMTDGNSFSLPKGGIIPNGNEVVINKKITITKLDEKTADEIYDELMQNADEVKKSMPKGFDEHIISEPKTKEEIAEAKKIQEEWKGKMAEALQHAKLRGSVPASLERLVGNILEHKVDWRSALYKFITNELVSDYTWNKRSRRSYSTGLYMPSPLKEEVRIVAAIDVSGSIQQAELTDFLSEIIGISKSFHNVKMSVMFHDVEVSDVIEVSNGGVDKILSHRIVGGGGTSHQKVMEKMDEDFPTAKLLINFSDGFTDVQPFNEKHYKVMWVISKGGSTDAPLQSGGEIVEL